MSRGITNVARSVCCLLVLLAFSQARFGRIRHWWVTPDRATHYLALHFTSSADRRRNWILSASLDLLRDKARFFHFHISLISVVVCKLLFLYGEIQVHYIRPKHIHALVTITCRLVPCPRVLAFNNQSTYLPTPGLALCLAACLS